MAKIEDLLLSDLPWGFDTETTGLEWFKEDALFAMSLSCGGDAFYYDIRTDKKEVMQEVLKRLFAKKDRVVYIHSAKFDMHFAKKFLPEVQFQSKILDTEVLARIWKNDLLSYSLDSVAKLFGLAKDDAVKKWIQKNKAYRTVQLSLEEKKIPEYIKVPIEIMSEYALRDAKVVLELGERLMESIRYESKVKLSGYNKSLLDIVELERLTTLALFDMEETGVLIDTPYVRKKFEEGCEVVADIDKKLIELCGPGFKDSAKFMKGVLQKYPEDLVKTPLTKTGLLSLTDDVLEMHKNPVSALIRERRKAYKEVGTYYSSFLDLADKNGRIHTNFKQTGAATMRMSCNSPNLQNIPKDEDDPLKGMDIRRCFIPPEEYFFVSMDFKQQELRVIFDSAEQRDLIEEIKQGKDAHQATAELVGCTRKEAKALNFAIAYGSGVAQITTMLGKPLLTKDTLQALYFEWRGLSLSDEQKSLLSVVAEHERIHDIEELKKYHALKESYLAGMPKVNEFNRAIINKAKKSLWICNSFGAIYQFKKEFSYKALNYFTQGGSSHITKTALVRCCDVLRGTMSKPVLVVHDEIGFYIHKEELYIIEELKEAMRSSYKPKILPMDVDVSMSNKSWGDLT